LVSLVYNIGISAFRNSTLLRKVNANPNDSTIRAEFLKWVNSGGKELPGLVKRRKEEADYYFSKTSGLSPFFLIAVGLIGAGIILSNQGDE
jgi:lysozyme